MHWLSRAVWWLLAYDQPRWAGDYVALGSIALLVTLGTLALGWPWISEEAPRAIAIGWGVVQSTVGSWLARLQAMLPEPGWPL